MKLFNGFVFGTGLGFICGAFFWLMWIPSLDMFAGERGWGLMIISPAGTLLTTVAGAVAGIVLGYKTRRSKTASIAIAVSGYALAAVIAGYVVYAVQYEREWNAERDRKINEILTAWETVYGAVYPATDESLPALFGPLLYPGSRLKTWTDLALRTAVDRPGWEIEVTSDDTIERVLNYYMSVLPEGLEYKPGSDAKTRPWRFMSEPQDSGDSRETTIYMQDAGDHFVIRFHTRYKKSRLRPTIGGGPLPTAWPDEAGAYRAHVSEYQQQRREANVDMLNPAMYPGARMATSQFPSGSYTSHRTDVYLTDDSWDAVIQYLTEHVGPPRVSGAYAAFQGLASGNYRVDVDAHSRATYGPFDSVLLEYKKTRVK